jgi:hypothetical protein
VTARYWLGVTATAAGLFFVICAVTPLIVLAVQR